MMPIAPVKLPSTISGQQNGMIERTLLGPVDGNTSTTRLMEAKHVAPAMLALHKAASRAGFTLGSTGRYRTLQQQWDIFGGQWALYQPCTPDVYNATEKARRKLWPNAARNRVVALLGPQKYPIPAATYWVKIRNANGKYPASSATPGTSNHGEGCADDLAQVVNGRTISLTAPCREWLYANAPRFGFAWQTQAEPWHVHWIMGDATPPALRSYEMIRVQVLETDGVLDPNVLGITGDRVQVLHPTVEACWAGAKLTPDTVQPVFRPVMFALDLVGPLPIYPATWTGRKLVATDFRKHYP